jgi:hypothetical protein
MFIEVGDRQCVRQRATRRLEVVSAVESLLGSTPGLGGGRLASTFGKPLGYRGTTGVSSELLFMVRTIDLFERNLFWN